MTIERPNITQEHVEFNDRIVQISRAISEQALANVYAKHSVPDLGNMKEVIRWLAAADVQFTVNGQDGPRKGSRLFAGSIAGGDSFFFRNILLPEEAPGTSFTKEETAESSKYPGRVIGITAVYGAFGSANAIHYDAQLYTSPDIPPTMVDMKKMAQFPNMHTYSLKELKDYGPHLPDSAFYYPNNDELNLIQSGLEMIGDEVDSNQILLNYYWGVYGDDEEPGFSEIRTWLTGTLQEQGYLRQ